MGTQASHFEDRARAAQQQAHREAAAKASEAAAGMRSELGDREATISELQREVRAHHSAVAYLKRVESLDGWVRGQMAELRAAGKSDEAEHAKGAMTENQRKILFNVEEGGTLRVLHGECAIAQKQPRLLVVNDAPEAWCSALRPETGIAGQLGATSSHDRAQRSRLIDYRFTYKVVKDSVVQAHVDRTTNEAREQTARHAQRHPSMEREQG